MYDRKPSAYISDIINCIKNINTYTSEVSFDEFSSNFMVVEACLYNIQVIGEAVSKLPEDVKSKNSHVPWKLIKGIRNRLIHDYIGTDIQMIWNIIQNDLPALDESLKNIYADLLADNK